jgi:glycosyltransferase involved in cell wall biosynthesis
MTDEQRIDVSILIPTYNQSAYILEAVESALAQDYPYLEVVVSDDCSPDGTAELVESRVSDPRLRVIRNPSNLGRVANYRSALAAARGRWVINLDGDDYYIGGGYISSAMRLVEAHSELVFVFGRRYIVENGRRIEETDRDRNQGLPCVMCGNDAFLALPSTRIVINHMTCMYRRDLAIDLFFYRIDVQSSDWESIYRMAIGRMIGFLDEYCGAWRRHEANASRSWDASDLLNNYLTSESLYDFAKESGQFSLRTLDAWLCDFVAMKLRNDFSIVAKRGSPSTWLRLIARAWRVSPRGVFRAVLTKSAARTFTRSLKRAIKSRVYGRVESASEK